MWPRGWRGGVEQCGGVAWTAAPEASGALVSVQGAAPRGDGPENQLFWGAPEGRSAGTPSPCGVLPVAAQRTFA